MKEKKSVIEDFCGVITLTATLAVSAVVLLARSIRVRGKMLPLNADVEAVLSLSSLILQLYLLISPCTSQHFCPVQEQIDTEESTRLVRKHDCSSVILQ